MELEIRACTLCGPGVPSKRKFQKTGDFISAETFHVRQSEKPIHLGFRECSQCGILFSELTPSEQDLETLYGEAINGYEGLEAHIYRSYEPILDKALRRVIKRDCFAEVGGGSGFMLRYGRERGFKQQIEIEPSRERSMAFEKAKGSLLLNRMYDKNLLPPGSVDLFCFFQVLDHLPHPLTFLLDARNTLSSQGVAVGIVHNTRAFSARALGGKSPIYGVWHTYLYHPKNLRRLFEEAGFAEIDVFPISNRYPLHYWCYEAPLPPRVKKLALTMLEKSFLGKIPLRLYAGNLAVIASKGEIT